MMTALLTVLLACYLLGLLPLCTTVPHRQNLLAHGFMAAAESDGHCAWAGRTLGHCPLSLSLSSNIPHLTCALRLDPLAAFFRPPRFHWWHFPRRSMPSATWKVLRPDLGEVLELLLNGFLLSMTLVVLADNGFFFLILWEIMSLLSYLLVVTEQRSLASVRPGCSILIMTHVGTAFIMLTFLSLRETCVLLVRGVSPPGPAIPDGL